MPKTLRTITPPETRQMVRATLSLSNQPPVESTNQNIQVTKEAVLNGAQIQAASGIVSAVSHGDIPRDSGIGQLEVLFNLTRAQAEAIVGSAGNPRIATTPNPRPQDAADVTP